MDNYYVSKLIPLIHEAGVGAVANPLINVTIQGRHDTYPKRRGMTRVPELMAAGVTVAFGHDCVMDPWYSLGSADSLEVASMGLHVAQMTSQAGMRACFDAVTVNGAKILHLDGYGIAPGNRADFVLLQARDPIEAIRLRAPRLKVFRAGKVVAETPAATAALHVARATFERRLVAAPRRVVMRWFAAHVAWLAFAAASLSAVAAAARPDAAGSRRRDGRQAHRRAGRGPRQRGPARIAARGPQGPDRRRREACPCIRAVRPRVAGRHRPRAPRASARRRPRHRGGQGRAELALGALPALRAARAGPRPADRRRQSVAPRCHGRGNAAARGGGARRPCRRTARARGRDRERPLQSAAAGSVARNGERADRARPDARRVASAPFGARASCC